MTGQVECKQVVKWSAISQRELRTVLVLETIDQTEQLIDLASRATH
ncbi:hypothetical protein [Pseudomonas sp. GV085]|nr:hypothetical protein [Pseudomonas sp. GV085]PTR29592.1 hypothetical protein C8K63_101485 [Pseudomonas sp. GV085]